MRDKAQVIDIGHKRRVKGPCPERLPDEEAYRLLKLAARDRRTLQEVTYAWQAVYLWAHTNGRLRIDWVMVCLNAMRQGWGLKGFKAHWDRLYKNRPVPAAYPGERITEKVVERVLLTR